MVKSLLKCDLFINEVSFVEVMIMEDHLQRGMQFVDC